MDLTAGTRASLIAAVAITLGGLTLVVHGLLRGDLVRSVSGACLTTTAVVGILFIAIRTWIVDTSNERRILAAAQRQAQDERTRYIAAQAAIENEQVRFSRDMATERAGVTRALAAEREAMRAEFEERKAALISETMEATLLMIRGGKLAPEQQARGTLIRFPGQPARAAEPERSRERGHGFVGP